MASNNKNNKNKQNKQNKKVQETKSTQQKKKTSTTKKSSSSCCKWFLGSLLLIGAIGALIAYDTHINGNGVFEKSATGKWLKNAGLLPHVEKAWYKTMSTSARAYQWAEKHVPVYLKPVLDLSCDLFKLFRNALFNFYQNLKRAVNTNAPAVSIKIEEVYNVVVEKGSAILSSYKAFLATNVFVGSLSPENLQKALNETRVAAVKYYSLFHQKVDTYAKIQ